MRIPRDEYNRICTDNVIDCDRIISRLFNDLKNNMVSLRYDEVLLRAVAQLMCARAEYAGQITNEQIPSEVEYVGLDDNLPGHETMFPED